MRWLSRVQERVLLQRARSSLEEGNTAQAEQLLEAYLRRWPGSTEALRLLAQIRWAEDDLPGAEALLEQAYEHSPHNADVREDLIELWLERAFAARQAGDVPTAVRWIRRALELEPTRARLHYLLGCAYADRPEEYAREAFDAWHRALELRPDYVEPHFDLGQVYFENERFAEAKKHLLQVHRLRPDWPAPAYLLAIIALRENDLETALNYLRAAITANPTWAQTAADDPQLAPLRGHPDFEALVQAGAWVPLDAVNRPPN